VRESIGPRGVFAHDAPDSVAVSISARVPDGAVGRFGKRKDPRGVHAVPWADPLQCRIQAEVVEILRKDVAPQIEDLQACIHRRLQTAIGIDVKAPAFSLLQFPTEVVNIARFLEYAIDRNVRCFNPLRIVV
jgi:hypothetical protein